MQKELNPELFGENLAKSRVVDNVQSQPPNGPLLAMEGKIAETRSQLHQLGESLTSVVNQVNEFIKGSQGKFERLNQVVKRLEQNDQAINLEAAQKISQISSRLGERKTMDLKIQEMVDRHNSVLRSFEVRFNQMQKLMSDKEAMLVSAQAALNDAKMEISRLKRL